VLDEQFQECIGRICAILDGLEIPYHFTGGIAASYYGEPRLTQDIDLVLQLQTDRPETMALLEILASKYLVNRQTAVAAIRDCSLFQLLEQETAIKIDLHIGEKIPGELRRSTREEILPGVVVPLVCRVDAILSKLLWVKLGSGKSKRDAIQMLKATGDPDRSQLRQEALKLGVGKELSEVEAALLPGHQPEDPRIYG
jgi:hypothetical protein